jgi:nucleoside-diphosphate-sugar epimerase
MPVTNILVTGANGFIGRSLCPELLNRGYAVRSAVRSLQSLSRDLDNTEKVAVGDISSDTGWQDALSGIDVVIHLAGRAHVMHETAGEPETEFLKVNVSGAKRLALQAASAGVKRFVFISTIKVNGEKTNDCPFTEKDKPHPFDFYAASKWEAEQVLRKIEQETAMEVVILRPPMVYGPNAPGNFARLIKLITMGFPLPLGSIRNLRSFIYIGNLIDGIISCIGHPNAAGQTFLVSDGQDLSTPELIVRLASALNKHVRLLPLPLSLLRLAGVVSGRLGEIRRLTDSLRIDITKIRSELNWNPPFTVSEGLKSTAEWFISHEAGV